MDYPIQSPQPLMRQSNTDITRWIENIEDIIVQLEHDFAGETYDEENDLWQKKESDRLMNARGINATTKFIRMYVNRNTTFSELTEERVMRMCQSAAFAYTDLLFFNIKEFNVNLSYFQIIVNEVMAVIEMAMRRAIGGKERDVMMQPQTIHRVYSENRQSNSGMFGGLFKGKQTGD